MEFCHILNKFAAQLDECLSFKDFGLRQTPERVFVGNWANQRFVQNMSKIPPHRVQLLIYFLSYTRNLQLANYKLKIYPQISTNFFILSTETLRYRSPSSSDTWNDTLSPIPVASTPQPLHVLCNCLIPVLSMIFWALFSLTQHPAMISIWFPYFF